MATNQKDRKRAHRRTLRVRSALKKGDMPRVSVFRSHKHIYGQIIDDVKRETVVAFGSVQLDKPEGDKKAIAHAVGKALAKKAKEQGVDKLMFDRGPYKYHGRVKALADGLVKGVVLNVNIPAGARPKGVR